MQLRTGTPLLEVSDVERKVGTKTILAPVSFQLWASEAMVVSGPNGSGKTTLLRILLGKDAPSAGSLNTHSVNELGPTSIASAMGAPPVYQNLTIAEHFKLVQASWGGSEETGDYLPILEKLRCTRLLEQFPDELSSGERQLFGLCLALFRPSSIVILDEPEQRLDRERRKVLNELLNNKKQEGTALVVASHDAELINRVADKHLVLQDTE